MGFSLDIMGDWGDPIDSDQHAELVRLTSDRFDGRCAYCQFRMPVTTTNPNAGLNACNIDRSQGAPDLANLVALCDFCVNLNRLENLRGKGVFVELPWFSQSELTNALRVAYCLQKTNTPMARDTALYNASTAITESLVRLPSAWQDIFFDGSPGDVQEAVEHYQGFEEKEGSNHVLYINRLRFFWHAEPFLKSIEAWEPTVSAQAIAAQKEG